MAPAKFLEKVGKAVTSLAGAGGTGGARDSALEKMQSEHVRVQIWRDLQTNPDPRVQEPAT